jgi:PAS domain S-box-containing protein
MNDEIKTHTVKKLNYFIYFGYPLGISYLLLFTYVGAKINLLAPILFLLGVLTSQVALKYNQMTLANSAGIASALLAAMISVAASGGPSSPVVIWLAVIPSVAPLVLSFHMSLILGSVSLLYTASLFLINADFFAAHNEMQILGLETTLHVFSIFCSISFTVIVAAFASKEREKTLSLLSQSRSWNQMILDNIGECLIVVDSRGTILSTNSRSLDLFGYKSNELTGKNFSNLVPKVHLQKINTHIQGGSTTGTETISNPDGLENTAIHRDGHEIPIRLKVSQIAINDEILFVGLAYDLVEQKNLERDMEQQRALAFQSAKFASLGQLAGSIAHEINSPLGAIMLSASSLDNAIKKGELDIQRARNHANSTLSLVKKIARIVSALKSIGGVHGNNEMSQIDIRSILDEILTIAEPRAKNANIKVEVIFNPPNLTPQIVGHSAQLSQIFINLINNSIDAIIEQREKHPDRPRSLESWIQLHTQIVKEQIQFRLTDSGQGIPQTVADRIFDPFYTTKNIGAGTGIGLSISKQIANNHGGSLILDRRNPNTSFVLTLPMTHPQQQVLNRAN